MLHCHPVVDVAVAGMEVEYEQQVWAFKHNHLVSLIQSRDCCLLETKARCKWCKWLSNMNKLRESWYCSDVVHSSWVLRCFFFLKCLRRNKNLNKLNNCWCEFRGKYKKQKTASLFCCLYLVWFYWFLEGFVWWHSLARSLTD